MKRRFAATILSVPGLRRLSSRLWPRDGVLILNYHRIGEGAASLHDRELWSATAAAFDRQLGFLKANCDVIPLDRIEDALVRPSGRRRVAITFDDGYRDNYDIAYPLLRKHGLPAAFFIATGFIDHPRLPWWDEIAWLVRSTRVARLTMAAWLPAPMELGDGDRRATIRRLLHAYKTLPAVEAQRMLEDLRSDCGLDAQGSAAAHWMTWDMIRQMADDGMTIGGHTVDHPVLANLPAQAQQAEIQGCADRLRAELGQPMDYFAYPVGSREAFNDDTRRCLRAAGVRLAFSYYGGLASSASERYDMQRVAVETHMGNGLFRAMTALPQVFGRPAPALT